jgi:hypothetical protein
MVWSGKAVVKTGRSMLTSLFYDAFVISWSLISTMLASLFYDAFVISWSLICTIYTNNLLSFADWYSDVGYYEPVGLAARYHSWRLLHWWYVICSINCSILFKTYVF